MRKTFWQAAVALLASCKPGQKLTGVYQNTFHEGNHHRKDSIILWKEDGDKYEIWRRTNIDYIDPALKDSTTTTYTHGTKKNNSNTIREDSTNTRYRYHPRERVLEVGNRKFRRIGG